MLNLVPQGQPKRGAMSTEEKMPQEWGGESIGRKNICIDTEIIKDCMYTEAAFGIIDSDSVVRAPRTDRKRGVDGRMQRAMAPRLPVSIGTPAVVSQRLPF